MASRKYEHIVTAHDKSGYIVNIGGYTSASKKGAIAQARREYGKRYTKYAAYRNEPTKRRHRG